MGDLVILEERKLRTLALLVRNNEVPIMRDIQSEVDKIRFLQEVSSAYDNVIKILNMCNELRKKHEGVANAAEIAEDVQHYMNYGVNMSLQCIRNSCLRSSYVESLKQHLDDIVDQLDDVNNLDLLSEEVAFYKKAMLEYANSFQSATARLRSREYSLYLMHENVRFPDLVNRHKNRLGYKDEFEVLEEEQKFEVYNSIIRESGRADIPIFNWETTRRIRGRSILFKAITSLSKVAAMTTWDIYTNEFRLESLLRTTLKEASSFTASVAVQVAITTVTLKSGTLLVSMAGFVVGAVVGAIFAAATGALLDVIFGSGGKEPPNLDNIRFYSVTLPDGLAFAYELLHMD